MNGGSLDVSLEAGGSGKSVQGCAGFRRIAGHGDSPSHRSTHGARHAVRLATLRSRLVGGRDEQVSFGLHDRGISLHV